MLILKFDLLDVLVEVKSVVLFNKLSDCNVIKFLKKINVYYLKHCVCINDNCNKMKVLFLGFAIFKRKTNPVGNLYSICGIPVCLTPLHKFEKIYNKYYKDDSILVLNHMLGGGTDVYFNNWLGQQAQNCVINLQYNGKYYYLTLYVGNKKYYFCYRKFPEFLRNVKLRTIIVNHFIGYRDEIFDYIELLKQQTSAKVVFNGHDYYSFCPNICLIKPDQGYCNFNDIKQCQNSCGLEISAHQEKMHKFLSNIADEIVLFSESSKKYFMSAFQDLETKIKVIPHCCHKIDKVVVPEHQGINITVIGVIGFHKGSRVVNEIYELLKQSSYQNIKIGIIGECKDFPEIPQTGSYNLSELPSLIKHYKTDIILVASICPETFSYVTVEAIQTGLPVACFNIGAQAEKVSQYSKGLVIDSMDAKIVLDKIQEQLSTRVS